MDHVTRDALAARNNNEAQELVEEQGNLRADHVPLLAGVGDFEKKFPASACQNKKIACSTNVTESLWEKREKNILPSRLLEKKILDHQKSPTPPLKR